MKTLIFISLLFSAISALPQNADAEKAESFYEKYKNIYKNDNSTKTNIKDAFSLLDSAIELQPEVYKYPYALAAGNRYITHYENAIKWFETSKGLTDDQEDISKIDNLITLCNQKLNKAKYEERRRTGAGIMLSFILKQGTNELDGNIVNGLPKTLPEIKLNEDSTELINFLENKIKPKDIFVAEEFIVVSLSPERSAETHYLRGIKPFANYYKKTFGFALPVNYIVIILTEDPMDLIEATNILYPSAGLDPYAPFLGYFNGKDNLIASNGGRQGYGTLLHELIHAYDYVDPVNAPIWLEEGLASLYERTEWKNGNLKGIPNWRFDRLDDSDFATLEQLITNIANEKYNLADIRMLLLYFDQQSKIGDFYQHVKTNQSEIKYTDLTTKYDISETQWQDFIKITLEDYKAELYSGRSGLSNPFEIKYIQQALNLVMNTKLSVDGIWGSGSTDVLIKFQEKFGLDGDGIYGTNTKNLLDKEYDKLTMK